MTRLILLLLAGGIGTAATGFAIHDLTRLPVDAATILGPGYVARADSARIIMMCEGCAGTPLVDVRLGRQDDGTEARVRAGTTTVAQLEALCQRRDPACRMTALQVEPAVGWMSSYALGAQSAHTVVVLRDGDLLTIRTLSSDAAIARRNADLLVTKLVPVVVGR